MRPRDYWEVLCQTGREFLDDQALRLSAALAYYSAFALAPLLLIAVSVAGAFFGEEIVRGQLDDQLRDSLGASAAFVVQDMVAHARRSDQNTLMSLTGFAMLLIGAGGLFSELQDALNIVWGVKPKPGRGIKGILQNRLTSFSLVLGTGFLLLSSMILSATLEATRAYLGTVGGLSTGIWEWVHAGASFAVIAFLFAAIFKVLPDVNVRWRDVAVGAVFTAVLFVAGKSGMGWYLGKQAMNSAYGSAGSLALVLLWLYYSAIILLFGAEFTQVLANRRGAPIGPDKNAVSCDDPEERR